MLTRIVLTRNPNLNYIAIAAASLLSKCRVLECEIHLDVLPDSLIGRRVVSERNTRHSAVGEVRRQGGFFPPVRHRTAAAQRPAAGHASVLLAHKVSAEGVLAHLSEASWVVQDSAYRPLPQAQPTSDFPSGKTSAVQLKHLVMPKYCSRAADGFSRVRPMPPSIFEAGGGPLSDYVTLQFRHGRDNCEHRAAHRVEVSKAS